MEKKTKLIIDTDGQSDDAVAIALALNDPASEVLFLTAIAGNVSVHQAAKNVLATIEHAGSYEPPVYVGCEKMLFAELQNEGEAHGKDGMGDMGFVPRHLKPAEGNAVFHMLETLKNSEPGEIIIVALGTLTHLALAVRLDFEAVKRAKRIVIMGSAGFGTGNVTPVAEYNIWQDAEAAKIVLESGLDNLLLVGWDMCQGDTLFTGEEIRKIRESGELGQFAIDCNRKLLETERKMFGGEYLGVADAVAMAVALCPACMEESETYYCQVDCAPGAGYGAVIIDAKGIMEQEPRVSICRKISGKRYKDYVYRVLHVEV